MIGQAAFWREGTGPDLTGITAQTYRSLKDGPSDSEPHGFLANGYQPRTWRLWTTGFGGTTSLNGDEAAGSADLATYTTGFAVGLDFQIDRTTLIGVAGGYTNSRFSVDQRLTGGIIEGGHVGLYGVKRLGPFYLAATAEYAKFSNETARLLDWVVEERAKGSFTSDEASARLEAGWRRSFAGVHVTPFAGIEISQLRSEGFTEESQGILGLTFGSVSVNSLQSSLGIQLESRMAFVNGQALTPFARIAWGHEFNPDRSIRSFLTLSPLASFSPDGASAASDFAKLHAGVKLDITKGLGLFAVFDGEFSDRGQSYAGNGGIRISW
jgi:outer membrane autotransporter protein